MLLFSKELKLSVSLSLHLLFMDTCINYLWKCWHFKLFMHGSVFKEDVLIFSNPLAACFLQHKKSFSPHIKAVLQYVADLSGLD